MVAVRVASAHLRRASPGLVIVREPVGDPSIHWPRLQPVSWLAVAILSVVSSWRLCQVKWEGQDSNLRHTDITPLLYQRSGITPLPPDQPSKVRWQDSTAVWLQPNYSFLLLPLSVLD